VLVCTAAAGLPNCEKSATAVGAYFGDWNHCIYEDAAAFRNCRMIGRRFRLAHILFATARWSRSRRVWRTDLSGAGSSIPHPTTPRTPRDDALRRDFTINGFLRH
jgi:hypothetical protein